MNIKIISEAYNETLQFLKAKDKERIVKAVREATLHILRVLSKITSRFLKRNFKGHKAVGQYI